MNPFKAMRGMFSFAIANPKPLQSATTPATPITNKTASAQIYLSAVNYDFLASEADKALERLGKDRSYLRALEYDAEVSQCYDTRRDFVVTTPLVITTENEALHDLVKALVQMLRLYKF